MKCRLYSSSFWVFLLAVVSPCNVVWASSAGAVALQALKDMDYRYFVAGGTCAAISHGITTPIDVVKTKIQANPQVSTSIYVMIYERSRE